MKSIKENKPLLTDLEIQIIKLVCKEMTSKQIALKLSTKKKMYPLRTVEGYRRNIQKKIGVRSSVGIALYAVQHGIIDANKKQ